MNLVPPVNRLAAVLAIVIAAAGLLLFAGDAVVRDQALLFAGGAALGFSVALSIVALPWTADSRDTWENVAWGKLFVAVVYASVAVVCLIAMAHTPDASRVAHALRAAL